MTCDLVVKDRLKAFLLQRREQIEQQNTALAPRVRISSIRMSHCLQYSLNMIAQLLLENLCVYMGSGLLDDSNLPAAITHVRNGLTIPEEQNHDGCPDQVNILRINHGRVYTHMIYMYPELRWSMSKHIRGRQLIQISEELLVPVLQHCLDRCISTMLSNMGAEKLKKGISLTAEALQVTSVALGYVKHPRTFA
jgi:hypothetical protein